MNYWTQNPKNIYVAGHRGWMAKYPDNTMPGFRAAIELGVDQIEFDVRATKDGELIVMHDETVDRTTNGTGLVCEKTLAEIKALDAGIYMGEQFRGTQVPTFIELMDYVKDHPTLTLDVELKEAPLPGREELAYSVCDRVLKIIDDYGYTDRVVINSFSGKLHKYIHDKYGSKYRQHVYFPIKHLGECPDDPYAYAYCCCMVPTEDGLGVSSQEDCDAMLERGVQIWGGAWATTEAGVDEAISKGVYLITANNPDEVLALLKAKGYHK